MGESLWANRYGRIAMGEVFQENIAIIRIVNIGSLFHKER
jgi:hypothetical protein